MISLIQQSRPPEMLPIIVVSGAGQQELARVHRNHPDIVVVRKPFSMHSLLLLIEQRKKGAEGSR